MTRERLENCYFLRKELALIRRRLESCGENAHQAQRLKERADELTSEIDAVEDYIASLDSSILRQMATLRFVEGMSLKDTAAYVGYSPCHAGRYIKKLFAEHL